jgi:hypothetical protein
MKRLATAFFITLPDFSRNKNRNKRKGNSTTLIIGNQVIHDGCRATKADMLGLPAEGGELRRRSTAQQRADRHKTNGND